MSYKIKLITVNNSVKIKKKNVYIILFKNDINKYVVILAMLNVWLIGSVKIKINI